MLGRRWIALALFLVPAATAVTIHGEDGEPVQADCAGDGSGEQMHALDDGSLFFPGRGCQATFALPEGAEAPVLVTYRVTGHVGEICGLFLFDGAVEGRTTRGSSVGAQPLRGGLLDPLASVRIRSGLLQRLPVLCLH
ncbi:MAG TPA: hypothetical protein VFH47_00535, partial [Candidatus Thermoplasmatota archaeon]|nr:hypothetical protein [Candidatus Thermoplasmatota archaeon]